jgi:hypothetical protein
MTPSPTPTASPGGANQVDFSPQTPEAGCQNTPTTSSLQLFSPRLEILAGGGQPLGAAPRAGLEPIWIATLQAMLVFAVQTTSEELIIPTSLI